MFKYFKVIVLFISVLNFQPVFAQDTNGSTKLSIDQCYEGEATKHALGCIPNCVCVIAEGCPCCTIDDLIAILNPQRPTQNKVILGSVEQLRAMELWQIGEKRRELTQLSVPRTEAEQAQYYTEMALIFLPDNSLNKLGIIEDDDTSAGIFEIPFEYVAYSACWWGGVAGGGDVIEVGDDCKDEWID